MFRSRDCVYALFTAALIMLIVLQQLYVPTSLAGATRTTGVPTRTPTGFVWREVFSPDGTITRVRVPAEPAPDPAALQLTLAAEVVPIQVSGPNANRFDMVFVGDGYTSTQLNTYAQHVQSKWSEILTVEPFKTYQKYFNAYRVNVISPQSGVDNDPRGVYRDTALDMYFWCSNIQRLLCVNQTKATQYANSAPAVDHILALANSTTYGGAGGAIATASGGNASSGQIAIHELGHSMGRLLDEYILTPGHYGGGEPSAYNTSIYNSSQMASRQTKWYRWLGETSPDGGTVSTYEGASQGDTGIYRPTSNSLMRSLGRPFNLPGREAMVMSFYRKVKPIDASTPTSTVLTGRETVSVTPLEPVGHILNITWSLDGRVLSEANDQRTLDLSRLGLSGDHTLTVKVVDNTPFVRDPNFRNQYMTETRTWSIRASGGTVTPTPVTRTPTPVTVTPTPITVTPTPITVTPTPVTATPGPGVIFSDNFESDKGWTVNPDGADTATVGKWERGVPEPTNYQGPKQIAAASPSNDLVTGRLAGADAGTYDLDGGRTSINSPPIALPSGSNPTLTFKYYLAYSTNSGSDDFLRVSVVEDIPTTGRRSTMVLEKRGAASNGDAAWASTTASLSSFAGQTVRILVEASDSGTNSLLEAAIDDVVVTGNTVTPTPITPTPNPSVFADDFETDRGWVVNPNGSDTATSGRWERGNPEPVVYTEPSRASAVLQLEAASGSNNLVTGRLSGTGAGDYDLDGGVSSIQSPVIVLPQVIPTAGLTLSFRYYLAHLNNASSEDYLRISVVEDIPTGRRTTVVFEKRGVAADANAAWVTATADLSAFAGQTVRILIEAADAGSASLVEAAIDDARINQQ